MKSKREPVQTYLDVGPISPIEFYKLSRKQKKGVSIPVEFYKDLVNMVVNPPEAKPSEELKSFANTHGLTDDWARQMRLQGNWANREAENQSYIKALESLAKKYGLTDTQGNPSFNKLNKAATVLAYASTGELKRLPKDLRRDIYVLEDEIKGGKIPKSDAIYASVNYFAKIPQVDVARMNKIILPQDRVSFGMQERIAEMGEREIRRNIGEGKNPAAAWQQKWETFINNVRSDVNRVKKYAEEENRAVAIREAWHAHLLSQQGGMQGRLAHSEFNKWLLSLKRRPKKPGDTGPHTPLVTKDILEIMTEKPEPKRAEQVLRQALTKLWRKENRGRGGERKFGGREEVVLLRLDQKIRAEGGPRYDTHKKKLLEIAQHLKAKKQAYGDMSKVEESLLEKTTPKKIKKFYPR